MFRTGNQATAQWHRGDHATQTHTHERFTLFAQNKTSTEYSLLYSAAVWLYLHLRFTLTDKSCSQSGHIICSHSGCYCPTNEWCHNSRTGHSPLPSEGQKGEKWVNSKRPHTIMLKSCVCVRARYEQEVTSPWWAYVLDAGVLMLINQLLLVNDLVTPTHRTKRRQTSANQHKSMKWKSMLVSAAGKTPVELQRACLFPDPFCFHVTALPCGYVSIMKSGEGRQSTSPGRLKCPDSTQPLKWSTVRVSQVFTHVRPRRE